MKKVKYFISMLFLIFMISFEAKAATPTVVFSDNFVKDGWNTEPFTITVTDPGIDKIVPDSIGTIQYYYRRSTDTANFQSCFGAIDNESTLLCTSNMGTGEVTLLIWSEDLISENEGNISDILYVSYKYDDEIPSVTGYLDNGVITIEATDYISGVQYYGISKSKDVYPTEWSTSNKFTPSEYGTYYLFAKDYAGNINVSYETVTSVTPLSNCKIDITGDYSYTGEEIIPNFYIYDGEYPLMKDKDYTLSISNNINAGNATITVTGKGNYTGTISKTFKINKAEQICNTVGIETSMRSPDFKLSKSFKLEFGNGKLSYKSSDNKVFKVNKKNKFIHVAPGIAYLTVTAAETENFKKTTWKVKVKIKPTHIMWTKLTSPKKGRIKIQWLPWDEIPTGYQIQISTSKKFTKKATKTYTVKGKNKKSKTIKGLKKGKKYYVRIRSYEKNKEGIVYGEFDSAGSIKVKK